MANTAPNVSRGCSKCESLSYSKDWHSAFGVFLCLSCKQGQQLVSKSSAKQDYLLTEGELKKLGSLSKPNPHKKDWTPMKLYLQQQVEALSYNKHGGATGLEDALEEHRQQKGVQRVVKRAQEEEKAAKEEAKLRSIRQKIAEQATQRDQFQGLDFREDVAEDGTHQRTYADGTSFEVELI